VSSARKDEAYFTKRTEPLSEIRKGKGGWNSKGSPDSASYTINEVSKIRHRRRGGTEKFSLQKTTKTKINDVDKGGNSRLYPAPADNDKRLQQSANAWHDTCSVVGRGPL